MENADTPFSPLIEQKLPLNKDTLKSMCLPCKYLFCWKVDKSEYAGNMWVRKSMWAGQAGIWASVLSVATVSHQDPTHSQTNKSCPHPSTLPSPNTPKYPYPTLFDLLQCKQAKMKNRSLIKEDSISETIQFGQVNP